MTLTLLALTPFVFLLAMAFRRVARFVTREGFRAIAEVNAAIQEAVTGISVAKNFRQEAAIYETFSRVNRQSYGINLRRGFVLSNIFPILNALAGVGTAALVYWGGLSVATGAISLGAWYLFIVSVDRFWFPMINVSAFWSQFQAGLAAAERIFALIDAEPTVRQIGDQPAPVLQGEICFEQCRFSLHRTGAGAARIFPAHRARRERGPGGAHRRGQEQHRQADRPLLRVPARADRHRRA